MLKDTEHIKRLAIIAIIIVVAFLLARYLFVPKSFYQFGYYRGESVQEIMKQPLGHAGSSACADCHREKYDLWRQGSHHPVNCENCHGALNAHTEDPSTLKPTLPSNRAHCLLCHAKKISRPNYFPQVDPIEHNQGVNCSECHNPHAPKL